MVGLVGERAARLRRVRLGTQPPRAAGRRGGRQGALAGALPRARRAQPRAAGGRRADALRGHSRWEGVRHRYVLPVITIFDHSFILANWLPTTFLLLYKEILLIMPVYSNLNINIPI